MHFQEQPVSVKTDTEQEQPVSVKTAADAEGADLMPSIWRRGHRQRGRALYASAILAGILFIAFILGSVIEFYQAGNPATASRCYSTLCVCLAAWMIGIPLWFWLEYFLVYRRWGAPGTLDQFKHGQQVTGAIWLGAAIVLGGFVVDNMTSAKKDELLRARTAQIALQARPVLADQP